MEPIAKVTVCGVVRKLVAAENYKMLIVSSYNYHSKKRNFIPFYVFPEAEVNTEVNVGDRVKVIAHITTSKAHPEGTMKVDSLEIIPDRMDALLKGNDYQVDSNDVVICGVVSRKPAIYRKPNAVPVALCSFLVRDDKTGYNYIRTVSFGRIAEKIEQLDVGDEVSALGYVQSQPPTVDTNGEKKVSAQSFVLLDIR